MPDRTARPSSSRWGWPQYALLIGVIWLGAEVVKVPIAVRAPSTIAVRIAPQSAEVLAGAAASELAQGRPDNAKVLAQDALARNPFNVIALRVWGLSEAKVGDSLAADSALTLAGNWSLRDTPTHAWLMQERLRVGDYGSAFAHADTLIRRRPSIYPPVFNLFSTAITADARALAALKPLLEVDPPWREAYFNSLADREDGDLPLAQLALALQATESPLTNQELSAAYLNWFNEGRLRLLERVRFDLNRPPLRSVIQNGDFGEAPGRAILPFAWMLATTDGILSEVRKDDLDADNMALRVNADSRVKTATASQIIMLETGPATLSGKYRRETATDAPSLQWSITCLNTQAVIASYGLPEGPAGEWQHFSVPFTTPPGCSLAQVLLTTTSSDRRVLATMWFDAVAIRS